MSSGRDREELTALLNEQLNFLRTSAQAFDAGIEHEYKRIALVLRVLLHDTKWSHSLLKQLGAKAVLRFWDTRERPVAEPGRQVLVPHDWPIGMVLVQATAGASVVKAALEVPTPASGPGADVHGARSPEPSSAHGGGAAPDPRGEGAWRYSATLGSDPDQITARMDFESWWRDSIIELNSGQTFARCDFVLQVTNKEGGAHVDPEPPVEWIVLRDQAWDDASGTVDAHGQRVPIRHLIPAMVRQIGYEVSKTLAEQSSTLD